MSSMIAPYIEPAYIKAVQEFDFDAVYAKYDEQMNETLNTGNGMCLQDSRNIRIGIMSRVLTE